MTPQGIGLFRACAGRLRWPRGKGWILHAAPAFVGARAEQTTAVPMYFSGKTRESKNVEVDIRYITVWGRRAARWLIVYKRLSVHMV
jgi:hypothetical protein